MPDGTATAALGSAPPVLGQHGRHDRATAKIIYQSQALRRAFGRKVAAAFLLAKRVPTPLSIRILSTADHHLRR